jgi:DNA-binding IclR family transcriptional regulator
MTSANSTADKAIEILLMFDDQHSVISAAEVGERFKMSRSTTYRYLSSLRGQGLLIEAGSGRFRLGHRIFVLARIARLGFSILEVAEPELRKLLAETDETILLSQKIGQEITVLECLESSKRVRINYQRGQILPTPAGAAAKVFLAFDERERVEKVLKRRKFSGYTKHTITDAAALARTLDEVRRQGFAINAGEIDEDVTAVAAPIYDKNQIVRYAVSAVAPSFRVDKKRLDFLAARVKATAAAISASTTML